MGRSPHILMGHEIAPEGRMPLWNAPQRLPT
jgi:hypothetical protein